MHDAIGQNLDFNRDAGWRVTDRVLDQVAHGTEQRLGMTMHPDRAGIAGERDGLGHLDGERRHEAHGIGADLVEIGPGIGGHDETLELGDIEDLVDGARHVDEIGTQLLADRSRLE